MRRLDFPGLKLLTPPKPGAPLDRAWRLTETLVRRMKQVAQAGGARFMVLSLPISDELLVLAPHPPFDPAYPDRRMAAFAARHGIPFIALRESFAEISRRGTTLFGFDADYPGWGHLNSAGHQAAAKTLAEFLAQHGLVP
jgi:hypothetical protein